MRSLPTRRDTEEDDAKFEKFSFALTGKTADQRTPTENEALKQLFEDAIALDLLEEAQANFINLGGTSTAKNGRGARATQGGNAPSRGARSGRVAMAGKTSKAKYKEIAKDDAKFEKFAFALTGKTADQRTPAENKALKQLRQEMRDGKIDPEVVEAEPANGSGPDRLPAGVRGAYVSGGSGQQGRVLISGGLRGPQLQRTSDEEQGEATADRAKQLGIGVADGDAGARASSVANGKGVSKSSALFKDDASDSTTVVSDGKVATAEADAGAAAPPPEHMDIWMRDPENKDRQVYVQADDGTWVLVASANPTDTRSDGSAVPPLGEGGHVGIPIPTTIAGKRVSGPITPDRIGVRTYPKDGDGHYDWQTGASPGDERVSKPSTRSLQNGTATDFSGYGTGQTDRVVVGVTPVQPEGSTAERTETVTIHVDPNAKDHSEFFYKDPNTGEWISMGDTSQVGADGTVTATIPAGLGSGDFAIKNHSKGGWIVGGENDSSKAYAKPNSHGHTGDGIAFTDKEGGQLKKPGDATILMSFDNSTSNRAPRTEKASVRFDPRDKNEKAVYYQDPNTGEWIEVASSKDAVNGQVTFDLPPGIQPGDLALKDHSTGTWSQGGFVIHGPANPTVGFENKGHPSIEITLTSPENYFEDMTPKQAAEALAKMPPAEASKVFYSMSHEKRLPIWNAMSAEQQVAINGEHDRGASPAAVARHYVQNLSPEVAAAEIEIIAATDPDRAAKILDAMPTEYAAKVVAYIGQPKPGETPQQGADRAANLLVRMDPDKAVNVIEQLDNWENENPNSRKPLVVIPLLVVGTVLVAIGTLIVPPKLADNRNEIYNGLRARRVETSPANPERTLDRIQQIYGIGPDEILPPGTRLSREELGISESETVHIDIGGEGYHSVDGITSGSKDAINLQADPDQLDSQTGEKIPNRLATGQWGDYPFEDGFADHISLQGAPLDAANTNEIIRLINPKGGRISLLVQDTPEHRANIRRIEQETGGKASIEPDSQVDGFLKVEITVGSGK